MAPAACQGALRECPMPRERSELRSWRASQRRVCQRVEGGVGRLACNKQSNLGQLVETRRQCKQLVPGTRFNKAVPTLSSCQVPMCNWKMYCTGFVGLLSMRTAKGGVMQTPYDTRKAGLVNPPGCFSILLSPELSPGHVATDAQTHIHNPKPQCNGLRPPPSIPPPPPSDPLPEQVESSLAGYAFTPRARAVRAS